MNERPHNERAQTLLRMLVQRYIRDGQPVGSKTLAESLALSSATIRNVLSDLETEGYLISPHTSAGRIPTEKGYRFFVNALMKASTLEEEALRQIQQEFGSKASIPQMLDKASSLLSGISQLAGIVTVPNQDKIALEHIEFLPLSGERVLVVLVTNDNEVQNKIIHTQQAFSRDALQTASNYINQNFQGQPLADIRHAITQTLQGDKQDIDDRLKNALNVVNTSFEASDKQEDFLLSGETNLFDLAQATDMSGLKQLFEAFNQKQGILHLLDQSIGAEGVQIFIGQESGFNALEGCSMVTSHYRVDGEVIGALGVIGPKRMPYQEVIPLVDVTARLLSAALSESED